MRRITACLILTLTVTQVLAQGVRNEKLSLSYITQPSNPLPEDYKTYKLKYKNANGAQYTGNSKLRNSLTMTSLEKVAEDGDLTVEFYKSRISMLPKVMLDKAGHRVGELVYYYDIKMYCECWVKVRDRNGNELLHAQITEAGRFVERPFEDYMTPADVIEQYNRAGGDDGHKRKWEKELHAEAKRIVRDHFDHALRSQEFSVMFINDKKEKFTDFNEAADLLQNTVFPAYQRTYLTPNAEVKPALDKVIQSFERMLSGYESGEKRFKEKTSIAIRHNLALSYFFRGDFEKTRLQIEALKGFVEGPGPPKFRFLPSQEMYEFLEPHMIRMENYPPKQP